MPRAVRDWVLLVAGLAGIAYEATSGLERPFFLGLYAAMLGLPAVLGWRSNGRNGNGNGGQR